MLIYLYVIIIIIAKMNIYFRTHIQCMYTVQYITNYKNWTDEVRSIIYYVLFYTSLYSASISDLNLMRLIKNIQTVCYVDWLIEWLLYGTSAQVVI